MNEPKKSPWKYIALFFLLAVICIGGVELAFCSVKEPELYDRLTAPARSAAHAVVETGKAVWKSTSDAVGEAWQATVRSVEQTWTAARDGVAQMVEEVKQSMEPEPTPLPESQELSAQTEVKPIPATAQRLTSMVERDGVEYLTGGSWEIVYYNQTEEPWADQPYGSDHIAGYGCGPTSMAMAVSTLTGQRVDPGQMAQWCVDNRHWASRHGSYLSVVEGAAEGFGLDCERVDMDSMDTGQLCQRLAAGELAVALMSKGHFTNSGHFILLRGVTLDGKILVADPASRERTLVTWEPELILEELTTRRHDGAPLWLLSPNMKIEAEEEIP